MGFAFVDTKPSGLARYRARIPSSSCRPIERTPVIEMETVSLVWLVMRGFYRFLNVVATRGPSSELMHGRQLEQRKLSMAHLANGPVCLPPLRALYKGNGALQAQIALPNTRWGTFLSLAAIVLPNKSSVVGIESEYLRKAVL
jgi:hypothetical protein